MEKLPPPPLRQEIMYFAPPPPFFFFFKGKETFCAPYSMPNISLLKLHHKLCLPTTLSMTKTSSVPPFCIGVKASHVEAPSLFLMSGPFVGWSGWAWGDDGSLLQVVCLFVWIQKNSYYCFAKTPYNPSRRKAIILFLDQLAGGFS